MLKIISVVGSRARSTACSPPIRADDAALAQRVAAIVADVRRGGDRALVAYARRFDKLRRRPGRRRRDPARRDRGRRAARRRAGAARRSSAPPANIAPRRPDAGAEGLAQRGVAPGVVVEQRVEPLERVGCYVPGGRYPLPSSLLMTAIPARVAGVREIDRRAVRGRSRWCWRRRSRPA